VDCIFINVGEGPEAYQPGPEEISLERTPVHMWEKVVVRHGYDRTRAQWLFDIDSGDTYLLALEHTRSALLRLAWRWPSVQDSKEMAEPLVSEEVMSPGFKKIMEGDTRLSAVPLLYDRPITDIPGTLRRIADELDQGEREADTMVLLEFLHEGSKVTPLVLGDYLGVMWLSGLLHHTAEYVVTCDPPKFPE